MIDFLVEGLVTQAKDQGSCGSCAAFAAVGSFETCMLKAGASVGDLDLSEQWLLDCAYRFGQDEPEYDIDGCEGAWPQYYAKWFVEQVQVTFHYIHIILLSLLILLVFSSPLSPKRLMVMLRMNTQKATRVAQLAK